MNGARRSQGILNQQTKKKVDRPGETCSEIERKILRAIDREMQGCKQTNATRLMIDIYIMRYRHKDRKINFFADIAISLTERQIGST